MDGVQEEDPKLYNDYTSKIYNKAYELFFSKQPDKSSIYNLENFRFCSTQKKNK
jgi:hypothetical protein